MASEVAGPMVRGRLAALVTGLLLGAGVSLADEIQPAQDAPQPSTPEKSLDLFRLGDGFRIELVAGEPLLADPTGIAWDENGRLFVCELHGYNLEGHLDVQALNKTGVLDRKVRRIQAPPEAKKAAEEGTYGTVKLLEDTDGDGRMDRAAVWAERLPPCYGLIAARGGLIVACAPDIVYLADRDGDGAPEVRETLFTGFGTGALERGLNTPLLALDHWIYFARGRGGDITGSHLDGTVRIGSTDFRIRADGSAIEPVTGASNTFGIAFTEFGDRFLITGGNHAYYAIPIPHRYLIRNPWVPTPSTDASASTHDRVYPISEPHPWRLKRSQDPAWVRFYGSREATASGYFTSACSPLFYLADAFPPEYRGNHFSCEPQNNLVHRCLVERDGAGYRLQRAPDESDREFLASSEKWFRPMSLAIGPDGALWIVDMYREIIEDYSAIPRFLQQQYGLVRGDDRGRIWRVVHENAPPAERPRLGTATVEELVRASAHPNLWWRKTAQRLLVEREARSAAPLLREQLRRGETAPARLYALVILDGLGEARPVDVVRALGDESWGVRRTALRVADASVGADEIVFERVLAMVGDPDPSVRLQLALTLGESRDPRVVEALVELAAKHGAERWMAPAIVSSAAETAPDLLARLLARPSGVGAAGDIVTQLCATVGAQRETSNVAALLAALLAAEVDLQERCLASLADGSRRAPTKPFDDAGGKRALTELLASSSREVRERSFEVVGALGLAGAPFLRAVFERSAEEALDARRPLEERLAAARLLANARLDVKREACAGLLEPRQPAELQLAAVRALAASEDSAVAELLLARWRSYSPALRESVLAAIFARSKRLAPLLSAIENGVVEPTAIDSLRRLQLVENEDADLRRRAAAIFDATADRGASPEVFERYTAALRGERDPRRGRELFEKHCTPCHRIDTADGEIGHEVGPSLASERERADETLLDDLLAPSRQIAAGYEVYLVATTDGRAVTGVLATEAPTSVTLRQAEAVDTTVLRKNIRALRASGVSLMPDNFAELITPRDAVDIIAFLRASYGDVLPSKVTLFDDEEDFAPRLVDGAGVAKIVTDDVFSGERALTVTPPQRYSASLDGWSYRIAERPNPGEYRFLRLAWKTTGGRGVMVELAASGRWPPAERPTRRYYSGENTTKWQAYRVSELTPTEWTVITVDLWRDNGTFTLTGIAPTAMGGVAHFDRVELLRRLEE